MGLASRAVGERNPESESVCLHGPEIKQISQIPEVGLETAVELSHQCFVFLVIVFRFR